MKNKTAQEFSNKDARERTGSFYTPKLWVDLSQKYLADVFGNDWQREYYVWDCAAGTGNLLVGLTNKNRVWASTLDQTDVEAMKDRMKKGANLLENHIFQFDFLNDDFSKLPQDLQDIIQDPKKRNKLIIYINPPYAECGRGEKDVSANKIGVANNNKIHAQYAKILKKASRELFAQFLIRIYCEIPSAKIANFSTLKNLQSANFKWFREAFRTTPEKIFLTPAKTFEHVKGRFSIGFMIWKMDNQTPFEKIQADIYDKNGQFVGKKTIYNYDNQKFINDWITTFRGGEEGEIIGSLSCKLNDFQNANMVYIANSKSDLPVRCKYLNIKAKNLIHACIYFTVRRIIPATWLNNRDQFLYPDNQWEKDAEFQNNCLAYALFTNNISTKKGVNHWIPFAEKEVNAKNSFDSHFMMQFLTENVKQEFSSEAISVFNAGRELWKYYHSQADANVNASFFDIKAYFLGRNENGNQHKKSKNETYNQLMKNLRENLNNLAKKIEPKVYEYGFLMQ